MPNILCAGCGKEIYIDPFALPYQGEVRCPNCKCLMEVYVGKGGQGTIVRGIYPDFDEEFKRLMETGYFTQEEITFLEESSLCIRVGAYTAAELSALKALESVLRRLYKKDETLGKLLEDLEKDEKLVKRGIAGIVTYFKEVRNRTAHPDRVSSKLDAESTFTTVQRLLAEIVEVYGEKLRAKKE